MSKYKAEILEPCLKQSNLLKGTKISLFRHLNKKLSLFFDFYNGLCFCKDVDGLMMKLGYEDKGDDRLFIDLSKASLKAVILHNDITHYSILVALSVQLKETYGDNKAILKRSSVP